MKHDNHTHILIFTLFFIASFSLGVVTMITTTLTSRYLFSVTIGQFTQPIPLTGIDTLIPPDFVLASDFEYSTDEFTLGSLIDKEFDGSNFTVGDVLRETDAYTEYYITYDGGGVTISGIMNVPDGDGPFPVLILNHGYIDPAVYTNGRGLRREQDYLAREGFVIVHPDYRNHAESTPDERPEVSLRTLYTEDVINAVVALKDADLPYVDENQIGMLGHSMGGGITLNVVSVAPDIVHAAVLYAPVSGDYQNIYNRWVVDSEDAAAVEESYGTIEDNPLFWEGLSAETFYDRIEVPLMFHQGDNDDEIPLFWTDDTVDVLLDKQKTVVYHMYPGGLHEFANADWDSFMERTSEFFTQMLSLNTSGAAE